MWLNDATGDKDPAVEQCVDDNTDASIKPLEKKMLIGAGIIEEQLGNTTVAKEVCGKIVARIPDCSPVELIIAAGNVTRDTDIIRRSMEDAVGRIQAYLRGGEHTPIPSDCSPLYPPQQATVR